MEIIKNFGVNPILLVAQIINFLIIFFILKKFLYKSVLDLLKKRQNTIKIGLEQAEEARIKLEKVVIEEKSILKNARLEARKIIDDARKEAVDISRQIQDDSKKQTEKMIKDAQAQITKESLETEKRLAVNVSKIAVAFLQKSLTQFFSDKEQGKVMTQALKIIKKTN